MSGDVQPRKRKDKRRRKDELSVEEPRGTAAVFGEGDVFMHSQHEHGTGGHWCAKVIFFSLLAVLVTLIGLIILENRGLSELEANAVESRYSGVLEGWLEDTTADDHHDEHTLELKHHDEEDDEQGDIIHEEHDDEEYRDQTDDADEDDDETGEDDDELDEDNEVGNYNDDEDEDNDSQDNDNDNEDRDQDDDDGDQNIDSAENEEDEDERNFRRYYENVEELQDEDDDDDKGDDDDYHDDINDDETGGNEDDENDDEFKEDNSNEEDENNVAEDNDDANSDEDENDHQLDDDNDDESNEYEESYATHQNEEEDDDDDLEEDVGVEVEKIEKEISDEDVVEEVAASNAEDKSAEQSDEETAGEDQTLDEEEFLESEDIEEPIVVERITAPAGKPLPEVEEETSSEKPPDTLAEEEEYEKQQEELRRRKEQASHLWLKVAVGGALLVATHAVIHRATAPRDPSLSAERASREESSSGIDPRMTLIPEEPSIVTEKPEEIPLPTILKEVEKKSTVMAKPVTLPSEKGEEEEEEDEELDFETKNMEAIELDNDDEDKELYSDDDIEEEVEQEVEVQNDDPKQILPETKEKYKQPKEEPKTIEPEAEPVEEMPEDVEIIDDEQLEEELVEEEDEDEEDISDVDDAELLSRLEAKYGRLPEPERPAPKKDGGNSLEDEWPGEPSDQYWRQQLDEAERELRQGSWGAAERRASAPELRGSARARFVRARALDAAAEERRDNRLLSQSIAAYLELLKMNERLSDKKLLEITNRTLDRIRFRGTYINAEPVYRLLIRRFPDDPSHRNNLSIAFLMANRPDLAEEELKETLRRWPDDRIALAHIGFILKTSYNKLEEAVDAMRKALEGDIGAANEPRFYFHLGDALLLLGRFEEASEVHKRGAKLGHFLSPAQRSLYNVERLKSRPWWDIEQTPYLRLARALEASWQTILKEGEAARALYEQEKEGLKEKGEWSQLDLFVRGQELPGRCKKAPITCSIVRQEIAAVGCKRGQIKFSSMEAGTHVRPHVGPTNCRLRMHLGLSNTKDTYIRVDKEIRQWQTGKVLMFDDSFEHEVWHNGTGARLVLIVDVWHPDLTHAERRTLPAI